MVRAVSAALLAIPVQSAAISLALLTLPLGAGAAGRLALTHLPWMAVAAVDRWCEAHPPDSPRMRPGARRWPEIEVSGGIRLENVRAYAETGVDYISVGAITHSARALDLNLEIEEVG